MSAQPEIRATDSGGVMAPRRAGMIPHLRLDPQKEFWVMNLCGWTRSRFPDEAVIARASQSQGSDLDCSCRVCGYVDNAWRVRVYHRSRVTVEGLQCGKVPQPGRQVRLSIVVRNALELHARGGAVTLRSLLGCLPDEVGSWTRIVAVEAVRAGGFGRVRPEEIAARTGWSVSTARQRLADTAWLLSVARTIGEQGQIGVPAMRA